MMTHFHYTKSVDRIKRNLFQYDRKIEKRALWVVKPTACRSARSVHRGCARTNWRTRPQIQHVQPAQRHRRFRVLRALRRQSQVRGAAPAPARTHAVMSLAAGSDWPRRPCHLLEPLAAHAQRPIVVLVAVELGPDHVERVGNVLRVANTASWASARCRKLSGCRRSMMKM